MQVSARPARADAGRRDRARGRAVASGSRHDPYQVLGEFIEQATFWIVLAALLAATIIVSDHA